MQTFNLRKIVHVNINQNFQISNQRCATLIQIDAVFSDAFISFPTGLKLKGRNLVKEIFWSNSAKET